MSGTIPRNGAKSPFVVLLGADGMTGQRSGVGRVTFEVARVLRQSPELAELSLLVGNKMLSWSDVDAMGSTAPAPVVSDTRLRAAVRQIPLLRTLYTYRQRHEMDRAATSVARRTGRPVLYHEGNMIARPFSGRTVVTIHDLSWRVDPKLHPAERVAWIERGIQRTLRQASRFIAVSTFTAGEMVRLLGIDRTRIDVVHPGTAIQFRPRDAVAAAPVLASYDLRDRGYVLAVSTREPRKNFDRLLAAHSMLPPALRGTFPLAIVGGQGWGDTLSDAAADRARREGWLRLLGHVADEDLVALYARCAVTAYPSLYEGFGLPVLEAMACAAPVVTANTTALPETAGGAAVLVDPLDVDAIAAALRRVLDDTVLADALREGGPAQAARFTWDRMAAGMIACWRTVLAS